MGKKKEKITDAAHVKRHTQGTSNELSFSVLDAAKNLADDESGKEEGGVVRKFGKVTIFVSPFKNKKPAPTPTKENSLPLSQELGEGSGKSSLGGKSSGTPVQATTSTLGALLSSDEEISRRKAKRRKHRLTIALSVVLGGGLLIGIASLFLYSEFSGYQEQLSFIDQALEEIIEADETFLVRANELVGLSVDELDQKEVQELLNKAPDAQKNLLKAEELAETAKENIKIFSDREVAEHASSAIELRMTMLESGQILLSAGMQAQQDKIKLEEAWEKILEADGLSREAAEFVDGTTAENAEASKEKLTTALPLFEEALILLQEVESSPLPFESSIFVEYANTRIVATQHAIATDEAILEQDRERAESENAAYIEADDEAIALASKFPDNREQLIMDAYAKEIEQEKEHYLSAQKEAGVSETFLRDYLGT